MVPTNQPYRLPSSQPSVYPSSQPSLNPLASPTSFPTAKIPDPTLVLSKLTVTQTLQGISFSTYNQDPVQYSRSIKFAIANISIPKIPIGYITNFTVSEVIATKTNLKRINRILTSNNAIIIQYAVIITNYKQIFTISNSLNKAVESGKFNTDLAYYGKQNSLSGLKGVTTTLSSINIIQIAPTYQPSYLPTFSPVHNPTSGSMDFAVKVLGDHDAI